MGGSPKLWLSVIFSTKMIIHGSMIGMIWGYLQLTLTDRVHAFSSLFYTRLMEGGCKQAVGVGVELKLGRRRVESMEHGEIWHMI